MSASIFDDLLPKPKYRDPCNGCGLCCLLSQCPISMVLFGPQPVCPGLEAVAGGGYTCGPIREPGKYSPGLPFPEEDLRDTYKMVLGAGLGCDCTDTDEDARIHAANPIFTREKADAEVAAARPEVRHILDVLRRMNF